MTAFSIGTAVSQLYLGNQPVVSLVNNGPATIYLDDQPGVSFLNGFELPPLGQMTWKGHQDLYAVTRFGAATLLATSSGQLQINTRSHFHKELVKVPFAPVDTQSGNGLAFDLMEVGHCNSLHLRFESIDGTLVVPRSFRVELLWYDDDQNYLSEDDWQGNILSNASTGLINHIVTPVYGRFVEVRLIGWAQAASTNGLYTLIGSDIVREKSQWCEYPIALTGATPSTLIPDPTSFALSRNTGHVEMGGWNGAQVYLPSWGSLMQLMFVANSCTTSGEYVVLDGTTGVPIGSLNVPVTATRIRLSTQIEYNPQRPINILGLPTPVVTGTPNISIAFPRN